jgi:hypothetical protein
VVIIPKDAGFISPTDYNQFAKRFGAGVDDYLRKSRVPMRVLLVTESLDPKQIIGSPIARKLFNQPQKCAKDGIFRSISEEKQRSVICKFGNFEATVGDRACATPRGTRAGSDNRAEA